MKPKKEVRWQAAARNDLASIVEYIAAQADDRTAEQFAERLVRRANDLGFFPYAGERCPVYKKARQLPFEDFVLYYTVHRREVVVRAVARGARLFRSACMRRD